MHGNTPFQIDGPRKQSTILPMLIPLMGILSCGQSFPPPEAVDVDRQHIQALSKRTLFFGHQSVGGNILDGARSLLSRASAGVSIVATKNAADLEPGTWAHSLVGRNEDPASKIAAFKEIMDGGLGDHVDLAFVKLCYVDFNAATDVHALFADYQRTLRGLEKAYRKTMFVHLTVPLTIVQTGVKSSLKKMLGKTVWGEAENGKRFEFNELLRREFATAPVFDLAKLEATTPSGKSHTVEVGGRDVEVMVPTYTYDDGHLNEAAQLYVASHLLNFLGALSVPIAADSMK
ncbi:MAG: hypothetical protein A2289_15685 [Deltaproteobacteria bacterium RIFOXYA12_FULL_58_15]|nr:MAG: hypothetical protein A2289_15685 [Deltaproteobacteria bacterium RIFOXYA12_FULL_58_15]OGR14873.1 MAG: hypothetical protein A2341_18530 [Deltaproteobacteria bacterium RIFOXYB12_FULL_58_9]